MLLRSLATRAVKRAARFSVAMLREDLVHYEQLYMRRWVLRFGRGGRELRLHHTLTPDGARTYLHDHPWPFVTILLKGSYRHLVQEDPPFGRIVSEVRSRFGDVRYIRHGAAHVIADVSEGGAWTLCITGRKRDNPNYYPDDAVDGMTSRSHAVQGSRQIAWGFWVHDEWHPARRFFAEHPESDQFAASTKTYFTFGPIRD